MIRTCAELLRLMANIMITPVDLAVHSLARSDEAVRLAIHAQPKCRFIKE